MLIKFNIIVRKSPIQTTYFFFFNEIYSHYNYFPDFIIERIFKLNFEDFTSSPSINQI